MNNPQISVIVPVYNTEKWLRRCVDSILAQTFTDFELLLIDDGSTDGSPAVCDEYAGKDCRVCVFHKPNGGVSSARDLGIVNTVGYILTFIDADDWVEPEYLAVLMSHQDSDLSVISTFFHGDDGIVLHRNHDACLKGENVLYDFLKNGADTECLRSPWGKAYRRDIIEDVKLRFDENLRLCEDTLFVLRYCLECRNMSISSIACYHYEFSTVNCENSLSRNKLLYIRHYDSIFKAFYKLNEVFKTKTGSDDSIIYRSYLGNVFIMTLCAVLDTHEYQEFESFTNNGYVKHCIDILSLGNNYGIKGKFYIKLIKNGCLRLLFLMERVMHEIG